MELILIVRLFRGETVILSFFLESLCSVSGSSSPSDSFFERFFDFGLLLAEIGINSMNYCQKHRTEDLPASAAAASGFKVMIFFLSTAQVFWAGFKVLKPCRS